MRYLAAVGPITGSSLIPDPVSLVPSSGQVS
jgi:hypothetical protein